MATKKTTIRHKKNKKGQVVETFITHREPAKEPAKPKPQNVADAWDAMKAAGELPRYQQWRTVNPYRDSRPRPAVIVGVSIPEFDGGLQDPNRRLAPAKPETPVTWPDIISVPQCPHRYGIHGDSCIKWMEHSGGVITGVCAHCPATFDTRNPEHLQLLKDNPKAMRNMGRGGQYALPGNGVGSVYGTEWQIFRYNYFPWLEVLQRRIVARFRALKKWIFTDF